MRFGEKYWSDRYKKKLTGWDVGSITNPIKEYIDQLEDKSIRILVPGCGHGHEVKYLYEQEFINVDVIDISPEPVNSLSKYCSDWDKTQFITGDFFAHEDKYDLILEQTFFSSINPGRRPEYARKSHELLRTGGKLVGLLFTIDFQGDYPPFGGSKEEYTKYFMPYFNFDVFEICFNSIKPRSGSELFIILRKE